MASLVALCTIAAGCGSSASSTSSGTGIQTTNAGAGASSGATQAATTPSRATGSTVPAGRPSPAKAKFIAQADLICNTANARLTAPQRNVDAAFQAEQTKGTAAHRAALAAAVRQEAAVAAAELAHLRALSPPAGDRGAVGRYTAAVASQVQLINQLAAAVQSNSAASLTAVSDKLTAGKTAVDALGQAYGFKVCANTSAAG